MFVVDRQDRMEEIRDEAVAADLKSVSSYGGQLASVFHNYSLIKETVPSGFEGTINIVDATVATLKQVLTLLEGESRPSERVDGKTLFSEEGLKYVRLLALECATTLANIEPIVEESCLGRKEREALQKQRRKATSKKSVTVLDTLSLRLDEKAFLEKLEMAKWGRALCDYERCVERLYELQLHLLLVFQVVTVYMISRDVSSGNIDIERLVTYHNRIRRTADLVGIKSPALRLVDVRDRFGRRVSFSSLDSSSSDSDSDASIKRSVLPKCRYPPPPPPPVCDRGSSSLVIDLADMGNRKTDKVIELPKDPVVVVQSANPPSYSESRKPESSSTLLGTVKPVASESGDQKDQKEKISEPKVSEPTAIEPRLFKSKSTGLGFKLKNLFRSTEGLMAEMRRTLSDTETHLTAFIFQKHYTRPVPHSAFHSLEATHMKTILSQLNNNSWYKIFSTLDTSEHATLDRLIHPWLDGKAHERELVVLKVLQQNRVNAWMASWSQMFRSPPFPQTGRVILAIFREKLINGKPIPFRSPPPPPMIMQHPRIIQHPASTQTSGQTTKVFDSRNPPPPPPPPGRGVPYPTWPSPLPSSSPFGIGPNKSSVRISDTTLLTDHDAKEVLTTYSEYTVRPCDSSIPRPPPSWSIVVVTKESVERNLVQRRVQQFEARDGNVIETKLRLAPEQSKQVTRIMDDIISNERDSRFEWCWVEISLHNFAGEITDFVQRGPGNLVGTANLMHLIAKRVLKPQYNALDVYNSLMRLGPNGIDGPGPPRQPLTMPPNVPPAAIHIEHPPPRKWKSDRSIVSDSDSDFDDSTTLSSDTSSVGMVRRRLRNFKAKKSNKAYRVKRFGRDDSDSDDEEEDIIKIDLDVKRGEDVVKKLLELWTVGLDGKGKGKMA